MTTLQFGSLLSSVHDEHRGTFVDWLLKSAEGFLVDGYVFDDRRRWMRIELKPFCQGPRTGGVELQMEEIGDPCDLLRERLEPVLVAAKACAGVPREARS